MLKLVTYLHENGMGYRKIAKWMNENGIKTERGKTFSNSSIHSVLKRYKERVELIETVREVKFEKEIVNFQNIKYSSLGLCLKKFYFEIKKMHLG